jgi:hypothetical protein
MATVDTHPLLHTLKIFRYVTITPGNPLPSVLTDYNQKFLSAVD